MSIEMPRSHDQDTAQELDNLRGTAGREGFAVATMTAMSMAEASIRFLSEITGRSATTQLVAGFLTKGERTLDTLLKLEKHPMPDILALARPSEFWSEQFVASGIRMSSRTLREKAIKSGLCYYVDKQVLITPAQIDSLFWWRGSSSARTQADQQGSAPRSSASRTYQRVRARLTKPKNGQKNTKSGKKP